MPVVGVAAGGRAQDGDGVLGGLLPVDLEVMGRRVEEDEPGVVDRIRGSPNIGAYNARPSSFAASTSRRSFRTKAVASVIESSTCCTTGRTRCAPTAQRLSGVRGAHEVGEVGVLCLVQLQCPAEPLHHALGDPPERSRARAGCSTRH